MVLTIAIVLFVPLTLVGAKLFINTIGRRRVEQVRELLSGQQILLLDASANFMGQESLGVAAVHGNGVLALTRTSLYFMMWLPQREIRVRTAGITAVETPRSYMGRSRFKPLLKVVFTNERGQADSAAWLVKDLEAWKQVLKEGMSKM